MAGVCCRTMAVGPSKGAVPADYPFVAGDNGAHTFINGVTFVTAHAREAGSEPDWRALAQPGGTVVFYMGLARLDHVVDKLLEHGAPAARPAGIIAQGTTSS